MEKQLRVLRKKDKKVESSGEKELDNKESFPTPLEIVVVEEEENKESKKWCLYLLLCGFHYFS